MRKVILVMGIVLWTVTAVQADAPRLGGLIYLHYNFEDIHHNEFGIKRAYLTYENKLNDAISYKLQLDAGSGGASAYSVFIKTAKIDWKTNFGTFTLGIQNMNMFKIQETTWGFRFIEKSAMDINKYSSSADLGIAWDKQFGPVSVKTMVTNGGGYKKAETDGHKRVSVRLHTGQAKLKNDFNAGVVVSREGLDYGVDSTGYSLIMGGFGGFRFGSLIAGAEYEQHTINARTKKTSTLLSAYGRLDLTETLTPFVRLDLFNQGAPTADDLTNYLIVGMNIEPNAGLSVAPNLRVSGTGFSDSTLIYYVNFQFKF